MDTSKMPKLGFGLMRLPLNNPEDAADINIELLSKNIRFRETDCTKY